MDYRATWHGVVLAESDDIVDVEGNAYFPADALNQEYFRPSGATTVCGWKGTANYYTVTVDGATNPDAAWYYPDPLPGAANICGRVAFWRGVDVRRVDAVEPSG